MPDIEIDKYTGSEIRTIIPEIAKLRTSVFREYPYLYDGGIEDEVEYLAAYVASPESLCVVVRAGDEIVGASTGLPLEHADPAFQQPFEESPLPPSDVFYFGESVLRAAYRGRGIGHRFFEERERFARQQGRFSHAAFCAVDRAEDHPGKPDGYRPLDAFWMKHGFERRPDLRTTFAWKDVGEPEPTEKPMVFWVKRLEAE